MGLTQSKGKLCAAIALCSLAAPLAAAIEWESIGPDGGDTFAIRGAALDRDTLFASSFFALFRSRDAAQTWQPIHDARMQTGLVALALDANDLDHLFVGTGARGIWESTDQGDSWSQCAAAGLPVHPKFPDVFYPVISLVYTASGVMYAGLGEQPGEATPPPGWIYRSDDGCATWVADDQGLVFDNAPTTQPIGVLLSRDTGDELWATVYGAGVYVRQGGVWESRNGNLPAAAMHGTFLAHDRNDTARMLLGTETDWIYETLDDGQTWSSLPLPPALQGLPVPPLVYNISIDPNNRDFVYALALDAGTSRETPIYSADPLAQPEGGGGYRTLDGGQTWFGQGPMMLRIEHDPRVVTGARSPRTQVWYGTSFGTLNLLKSVDGADNFLRFNTGMAGILVNHVWLHPDPPEPHQSLLFLAAESGLQLRRDTGPDWEYAVPAAEPVYGWSFAADPLDQQNVYYATGEPAREAPAERGIYRTTLDCFAGVCGPGEQVLSDTGVWRVVTTPALPGTLYAATQEEGVLVSADNGASWVPMNTGLTLPASVTDIELAADGTLALAALRTDNGDITANPAQKWLPYTGEEGGVYRWTGSLWQPSADIGVAVYDLAPHPDLPLTFIAAAANGVYRTDDGGQSWSAIMPNVLTHAVAIDPQRPEYQYAATRDGVWRSTNDGHQWHLLDQGMPQKIVFSLAVDANDGTVYAATNGSSVVQLVPDPDPQPVATVPTSDLAFDDVPVGFTETLSFSVVNAGEATLTVFSVTATHPDLVVDDGAFPLVLTAGGSADLTLSFTPQTEGTLPAQLAVGSNDPQTPVLLVPVTASARAAVPVVPDLLLDGVDGPVTVANGDGVDLTAFLTAGDYLGQEAEFWVRWDRGDGVVLWLVQGGGWVETATPQRSYIGTITDNGAAAILDFEMPTNVTGAHTITLAVDNNVDNVFEQIWSDVASFTVEPRPAELYATPSSVDFDTVASGFFVTRVVGLVNQGEVDLVVDSWSIDHSAFVLSDPPALPLSIAPSESEVITLQFNPKAVGPVNATLSVNSNDPVTPTTAIALNGTGRAAVTPVPDLRLDGADGLGTVPHADIVDGTVYLAGGDFVGRPTEYWISQDRADGTTWWLVQGLGWTKSATPRRFIVSAISDQPDPILTFDVPSNVAGVTTVRFAMDDNTDDVYDGDWVDTATYTVDMPPPAVFASSASVDFGTVNVGSARTRILGVGNQGEADLVITGLTIDTPTVTLIDPPALPLVLPAGENVVLDLRYAPTAGDPLSAMLAIASNDPGEPLFEVSLVGSVVDAIQPTVDIRADGGDSRIDVPEGQSTPITITVDPGDFAAQQADYFILYFTSGATGFEWGEISQFDGPLLPFDDQEVFDTASLAAGVYVFFLAVDLTPNGQLDTPNYLDSVVVEVQ